jgi:hypothetical protein
VHTGYLRGNLRDTDHMEDSGVDWMMWGYGLD